MLGNDVVDLRDAGTRGKAADQRFLDRVFTRAEKESIRAARDPDRTLWMCWAGKEAAFKIARKLEPGTPFAHRAFEVSLDGSVRLPERFGIESLRLRWEVTEEAIHCIAASADTGDDVIVPGMDPLPPGAEAGPMPPPGAALTDREAACVRTPESHAVRLLAKRLARSAGAGDVEIVREPLDRGFGPPLLYSRDAPAPLPGWDVSLSHHGRFVAAVVGWVGAGS